MRSKYRRLASTPVTFVPAAGGPDPALALTVLDTVPTAIAAFAGQQHELIYLNRCFASLLGTEADPWGQAVNELWPDTAGEWVSLLDEVYTNGQTVQDRVVGIRVWREGRQVPVRVSVSASPIEEDDGSRSGVVAQLQEIAPDDTAPVESVEYAAQLRSQLDDRTDELISILESTVNGIVFVDTGERIRFANQRLKRLFDVPDILLSPGSPYAYFHRHLCGQLANPEALEPHPRPEENGLDQKVTAELTRGGQPPRHFQRTRQPVHSSRGERLGWLETYREVTERKKTERHQDELFTKLEQDRRRLQTLELITRIGLAQFNVQEMSDVLLQRVLRASHAQAGELLLLESEGARLFTAASIGFENRERDGEGVRVGVDFAGRVGEGHTPIILAGDEIAQDAPEYRPEGFAAGILLGLPLLANGRTVGAMVLGFARTAPFSESDQSVLQILADRVGLVIENARLMEHMTRQAHELNALLDNLTEAIVVAEPSGRVVRLNQTALKILGRPEASGERPGPNEGYRLVINDTQGRPIAEHETPLARAARGETFSEEDLWVTGLDGVRRRVAVSGGPVRDEAGRVLFGFNVFRDITDLRELELMERALADETRAQREFLENVFRAAPIGLTVVSAPEHIIEMANPIARNWAQLDDPIGLSYSRVYSDAVAIQTLDRAVSTGETQNIVDREVKIPGQEPRYFSTTFLPLSEDGRTVTRVLIVSWETTDTIRSRQRAEQLATLAQQHSDEVEAVIAQLPEGVVIADAPNGHIRLLNPAALSMAAWLRTGRDGSSISMPVFETLRPNGEPFGDDNPLTVALTQGRTVAGVEALLRQPEGRTLPVLVSAAPLRNTRRVISGAVLTFRDITALKEIDRLKDEFLSMASHELKTPLTAVKGFSQLLLRRARKSQTPDERTQRALETIDEKVNYMSRLIEDLLDLSRVETDRLELRPTRTNLVALARSAVSELQMVTDVHGLTLETELDSLVGYWDDGRLEQVLINLVDNAIKYSPEGGPVVVRVEKRGEAAFVSVTDRGIGIHPDHQRRLFERFYRAHEDRMAIGGLGLGLYLSHEIIRRHEGQIGVKSDVGQGSTFWFELPLTKVPEG